ncbi:hypothetical protein VKT23_012437 [Stygiomarasmius scandens]|uniref:Uncharacterized protein n=1 Tax=Marasmiellus scandens TaxID=2682957 RepID=A0ABR1J8P6_9AGAR
MGTAESMSHLSLLPPPSLSSLLLSALYLRSFIAALHDDEHSIQALVKVAGLDDMARLFTSIVILICADSHARIVFNPSSLALTRFWFANWMLGHIWIYAVH